MNSDNKIIFILPSLKTGGGIRVVIELANKLILDGISVDVVYPNNSLENHTFECSKKINFIKIGEYKNSRINKIKNNLNIFNYLSKTYLNSIIIFTDPIMSIFIPLIPAKRNKIYRFIQADDYRIFDDLLLLRNKLFLLVYKSLTKISYKYKNIFIFNSRYTYDKFIEISKRDDVAYNLVHPSINKNVFYNQHIRPVNELSICIVARKHPLKGFIDFIKPFNGGNIHGIDHVYVISHDDLSDFDLSNVTLIKPKNDTEIAYYMNLSHIFISTSWWEGFGLPPLEAMACGCAVILTNAGGVNEYAIPDENCLMYNPKDQQALVECINSLVINAELRNKLSRNAVLTATNFSWEKSKNQLLDILNATT